MAHSFRSNRQRVGVSSLRRKTAWDAGPGATTLTQLSASGSTLIGSGAAVIADGRTLVRTRGNLSIALSAATTVGDGFAGAFGIAKVRDAAFAVGITALPTPLSDLEDQWLYHRFFSLHAMAAYAAAGYASDSGSATLQWDIDSKAMRKLTIGDTLVAVIEVVERGTAVADVWLQTRMLLKLP